MHNSLPLRRRYNIIIWKWKLTGMS